MSISRLEIITLETENELLAYDGLFVSKVTKCT
jgi:hypothetical protein